MDQKYQIDEHGGELVAWIERLACTFIDLTALPKQAWLEYTGSVLPLLRLEWPAGAESRFATGRQTSLTFE